MLETHRSIFILWYTYKEHHNMNCTQTFFNIITIKYNGCTPHKRLDLSSITASEKVTSLRLKLQLSYVSGDHSWRPTLADCWGLLKSEKHIYCNPWWRAWMNKERKKERQVSIKTKEIGKDEKLQSKMHLIKTLKRWFCVIFWFYWDYNLASSIPCSNFNSKHCVSGPAAKAAF